MNPTKVQINASTPVVEAGLRTLLEKEFSLFMTKSGERADVVLSDRSWHDIPHEPASTPVVMLSNQPPFQLIQQGARGVLPPNSTPGEIRAALEAAAAGLVVLPNLSPNPAPVADSILTAREKEVLQLLAQGVGNKEIAWRLSITEHTVKFHVSSLMNKLAAGSRTEAVTQGIRRGYVTL
jgi:DNA-binding NarL/FixJ family response regulator